MSLLQIVYSAYGQTRATKEKTMRKNLAKIFEISENSLTDSVLLDKLLVYERLKAEREQEKALALQKEVLEKDFIKHGWYEENKEKVEQFPEFVQSIIFKDNLPQSVLDKLPKGIYLLAKDLESDYYPVLEAIRHQTYRVCDFGRAQRKHVGNNRLTPEPIVGRRTECGGRYSSRCTFKKYDYYADYTFILSPNGRKVFYRLSNGTQKTAAISPSGWCWINGKLLKPQTKLPEIAIKPRHIQRVFEKVLGRRNSLIKFEWDRKGGLPMLVSGSEQYHFPKSFGHKYTAEVEKLIQSAINAFRIRAAAKIDEALIRQKAVRTFVSFDDSIQSGNCTPITEEFARKMWAKIGAIGECAVRADLILAERNDSYTKRAIQYAIVR